MVQQCWVKILLILFNNIFFFFFLTYFQTPQMSHFGNTINPSAPCVAKMMEKCAEGENECKRTRAKTGRAMRHRKWIREVGAADISVRADKGSSRWRRHASAHPHANNSTSTWLCTLKQPGSLCFDFFFLHFYLFFPSPEQTEQQQRASANKELNRVPRGSRCSRPAKSLTVQIWPLPSAKSRAPMLLLCLSSIPLCQ